MSKTILKQSSKIGFFALISRCIAFMRELLLIRFLSIGDTSDIFYTAFRIPNTMRKIFAEGSLSSVLVPALVNADHKDGKFGLNRLTTLSFLIIESIIFMVCALVFFNATWFISKIAPGFPLEKMILSATLLKILIAFILFMSSGAIFASALQAKHKFFIPALAPSFSNVMYVSALCICLYFNFSVEFFCFCMILSSFFFFLLHVIAYMREGFSWAKPNTQTYQEFKIILQQFLPCFFSVGILEINHFINTAFGSYLPSGSLTLLRYAYQFVNIPIGIITASLVTVLLPHFSKLHIEQPQELGPHLFEAIKFIVWTTMPICFLLGFFSLEIFQTLFIGDSAAMSKIALAQSIFLAYLFGLLSFSLNKIFLAIFYALRITFVPTIATFFAIIVNVVLNQLLMASYGGAGIAFASSAASIMQTIIFIIFLYAHLKLSFDLMAWLHFMLNYMLQFAFCSGLFWFAHRAIYAIFMQYFHESYNIFGFILNQNFFLKSLGLWAWSGPLMLAYLGLLYFSRHYFAIKLAYFDK